MLARWYSSSHFVCSMEKTMRQLRYQSSVTMAAGLAFMAVCSTMALGQPSQPVTPPPATPAPAAPAPAVPTEAKPAPAKDAEPAKAELTYATIETSMGNIVIELDGKNAPISMANFWSYANKGHYEGTLFHRVIPDS